MTEAQKQAVVEQVGAYVEAASDLKGSPTRQTRRIIAALRAIGLQRSDFRAYTLRETNGTYGSAIGSSRRGDREMDRLIIQHAELLVRCGLTVHVLNIAPGAESAFVAVSVYNTPRVVAHVAVSGTERAPVDRDLAQQLETS